MSKTTYRKTILIVDNDENIRIISDGELSDMSFTIRSGKSGFESLRFLKKNPEVDLLILDVKMDPPDSIHFTKNYGAGFGILQGQTSILIFIAVFVVGLILFYYDRIPEKPFIVVSVALILGGVVGNLIDRIVLGYVTDFVRFWIWPSFNIADVAASLGVLGLIVYLLKKEGKKK